MTLGEYLTYLRHEIGHDTAKSFHNYLVKRGLDCNYPTFVKITNGDLLPSASLFSQLVSCFDGARRDDLIRHYCRNLFPDFAYLFSVPSVRRPEHFHQEIHDVSQARELTKRQVACLARSEAHYHLFLVLSLARRSLTRLEINKMFKNESPEETLLDFENADLLPTDRELTERAEFRLRTTEWRFPRAEGDKTLKGMYKKFDEWDLTFDARFDFTTIMEKMMLRRVSPRYVSLIQKQLEICLDLIRASDEMESKYNEDTIQIRLQLRSGQLPG